MTSCPASRHQRCSHRRIDSAGHRYDYAHRLTLAGSRRRGPSFTGPDWAQVSVDLRYADGSSARAPHAQLCRRVRLRSFSTTGGSFASRSRSASAVLPAPETEADRVLRAVRRQPHRAQDVRWLERARRARRPCRYGDAFEVQRYQQRFGFHAIEADVRGVRDTRAPARH